MLTCACCGKPHAPAARDNDGRPVCATCATALLKTCPTPLLLPDAARALCWRPASDDPAPTWEARLVWGRARHDAL